MKENIINHIKSGGVKMNEEFVGVILFIVILPANVVVEFSLHLVQMLLS